MHLNLHNKKITNLSLEGFFILALSACSSIPEPVTEISSAAIAIESAALKGAAVFAPIELRQAKNKLNEAEIAVKRRENSIAKRLAEQAYSDAILARAIAAAELNRENVEQMDDSLRLLKINIRK